MINYGSVCSGIEAASVAWHPLGFRANWLSEIEAFPSAVLAARWPEVPNLGDMTKLARQVLVESTPAPEVLVADHGWRYELNAARHPIVGRVYARLKLAGVKPNGAAAVAEPWTLDLSKVS